MGVICSQTSMAGDRNFVRNSSSVRNSEVSARRELTVVLKLGVVTRSEFSFPGRWY